MGKTRRSKNRKMTLVAVIGAGYWGKNLVRNFNDLKKLHTICDIDESRLKFAQEKYPDVCRTPDYKELLNNPEIDAVVIAAPARSHFSLARDVLLSNKDVFVEKPLAFSSTEAKALKDSASKANLCLMVGHLMRYHPAVSWIRNWLQEKNLGRIFDLILENLPVSPAYYPKDELTDKSERFFSTEIIREKILLNYQKEIPYSVEVMVDQFHDTEKILRISSIIYVARESQKGIIIGHQGKALKKTGTMAREDMEEFFRKKIFLETLVKVKKDWRKDDRTLKAFGYRKK